MNAKVLPFLGVAALSVLLGAGPALAAPVTGDVDSVHARELRQRGIALQSDSPRNADKANHEMLRPGPYDGPMFDKAAQRDGVRPVSRDSYKADQGADPRQSGIRPDANMSPRRHGQPDARDQRMIPVTPARSGDDGVRPVRPQRGHTPIAPEQWKHTRGDGVPFSYHR